MIDLQNLSFSIENLLYFQDKKPYINQRMEGQLCYEFPIPNQSIEQLKNQDFRHYLNKDIFNLESIKKLKALKKAQVNNDKDIIQLIKTKIKVEKLREEFELQESLFKEEMLKHEKSLKNDKRWSEIFQIYGL